VNCPAPWQPATYGTDPAGDNKQDEKTRAFYSQLRFGWDDLKYPIDGNLGIRYVKTMSTAFGYTVFKPNISLPSGASITGQELIPDIAAFATPRAYDNVYHNLLPSLNLRMKANEALQFRFALAKGLTRPDFSQLQGYTALAESISGTSVKDANGKITSMTIDNVSLTGSAAGNPNLRPTTATSLDLTAEWYFAKAGSLPGWLSGFGTQITLTLVNSARKLNNPVFSPYCSGGDGAENVNLYVNGCDIDARTFGDLPLQGVSRKTVNFAVMYDKGPVSACLAYNWRSKYLQGVNNWGTRGTDGLDSNPASPNYGNTNVAWGLPLWQEAYGQLDGSIFYNVTDKLRVGLEAQNLNNATSKQSMGRHVGQLGHAWFVSGPRYTPQAQYSF
jgi:outer membrane receptor protein involved in Fe transport